MNSARTDSIAMFFMGGLGVLLLLLIWQFASYRFSGLIIAPPIDSIVALVDLQSTWIIGGSTSQAAYPLVICYIAIENGHLWRVSPSNMVIFHSYISLPKSKYKYAVHKYS